MKKLMINCRMPFLMLIISLGIPLISMAQNQLKKWYFAGKEVDFTQNPPVVNDLENDLLTWDSERSFTNGIYDPETNVRFWVYDTKIYNQSGEEMDQLKPDLAANMFSEIEIIPVPGGCGRYYLVYGGHVEIDGLDIDGRIYYSELDLSLNDGAGGIVENRRDVVLSTHLGSFPLGNFAVGGIRQDGTRFMYAMMGEKYFGKVYRYKITENDGIIESTEIFAYNDKGTRSMEEDMLAWGAYKPDDNFNKDVFILYINGAGEVNTNLGVNGLTVLDLPPSDGTSFTGVEFARDGKSLFAGFAWGNAPFESGIFKIDVTDFTNPPEFVEHSEGYGFSQIELAYNGFLYVVVCQSLFLG